MSAQLRRPGARRLMGTLLAMALAFAIGIGVVHLLGRRDIARRDRRALVALEQEVALFPVPPGVVGEGRARGSLCCHDGKCVPHFSRRDLVGPSTAGLPEFYRRAFQREGWTPQDYAEPQTEYFEKQLAGRRVSGSFRLPPDAGSAYVDFHVDAQSC